MNSHKTLLILLCCLCVACPRQPIGTRGGINPKPLSLIQVGSTTIEDVLLYFGEPDFVLAGDVESGLSVEQVVGRAREAELGQRERYFLYRWFTGRPMGLHGGVLRGSKKSNHLLIEFDDEGTVKGAMLDLRDQGVVKRTTSPGSSPTMDLRKLP